MPTTRRSAQEMLQALERWGLERWAGLRVLYAPLHEAAAREATAARALSKPKPAPRTAAPAPTAPPAIRLDAAKPARPQNR